MCVYLKTSPGPFVLSTLPQSHFPNHQVIPMEGNKRWKAPQGAATAMDGGAMDKAEALLKTDELDITEFTHFFARGFANQVVQSWSYYAQVNDHSKFTSASGTLAKLIKVIAEHDETTEYGAQIIKDILTSYSKTLYRALSSMRASTTNPVLRLINEIVCFKKGGLLDDFITLFDFTLPVLPKLLVPTKTELANVATTKEKEHLSMRYNMIRVLLSILQYSSALLRKDFVSNNTKIISNWFKHISSIDSEKLIIWTLTVLDEKILKEPSFKKATKLKILNEWNITKLLPIYYTSDKELRTAFNTFILAISTDTKYGLVFPAEESWFLSTNSNSTIEINKRHFKTHNKVVYSILSGLKPWDDDMQLNTTVQILSVVPELIPPYSCYLASRGLHDPKLTSYWIGQTLLVSKIIRLELPEDVEAYTGLTPPSKTLIAELIVPSVLNRTVLSKCLQSDAMLIRQLASQLIMDSIQKLQKFVKLYDSKNWQEAKVDLVTFIYHLLPDLATVTSCVSDCYNKVPDNKILLVTLLICMNNYNTMFSDNHNFSQAITKPYMDVINSTDYTSIDLVLLDSFLQLQDGESSQLKWWNKSNTSTSLFTSLLKVASSGSATSISNKVGKLISNLLKQTVVFNNENLKIDPAILLIHSLRLLSSDTQDFAKVWTLLDECISRCVRTPFKYLDMSNTMQRVSPFTVTLFEQWKFVDVKTDYKLLSKWFVVFLRLLILAGEPHEPIWKMCEDIEHDVAWNSLLLQDCIDDSIDELKNDQHLKQDGTFFGIVTSQPLQSIQKDSGIPVSELDVVGALARTESAAHSKSVSFKKFQSVFSELLSKVGNYWYTHPESIHKFSSKKFWSHLYLAEDSDKFNFVSGVLIEIFSQLDDFDVTDLSLLVKEKLALTLSVSQEEVLAESLWALTNESLRSVLTSESVVLVKATLQEMLKRKMTLDSTTLSSLLAHESLIMPLSKFIEKDLVIFTDVGEIFRLVAQAKDRLQIFRSLATRPALSNKLLTFVLESADDKLITYMACNLRSETLLSFDDRDALVALLSTAKSTAHALISAEDFSFMNFDELAVIFTQNIVPASADEKATILHYALEKASNKFAPEIPNLMNHVADFTDASARTWLNKSVLYLTKVFAEYPNPPQQFFGFLASFKNLVLKLDITKVMNKSNVNALLEVIFTKWVSHEIAMEFASIVAVTSTRSFLEFGKLLQILVYNSENVLCKSSGASPQTRFYTALVITRLYHFDPSKNSTASLQEKLLTLYSGSSRAEDLLLFKALEKLESKLNASWIDDVYSWDFLDDLNENDEQLIGETRLIEKKKEGYVVVLNKKYVSNSVDNYFVSRPVLELATTGSSTNWVRALEFFKNVSLNVSTEIAQTAYDPLFLSLLIANNDELISVSAGEGTDLVVKSNMKKLVESELLTSVVINLASLEKPLVDVTRRIIGSLLGSLKSENSIFKERHLFEIFFTKVLFTFERPDSDASSLTPLIFIIISRMVTILNNPGHMLYEKAFRWVLKNPYVRSNEIPLFQEITTLTSTSEENDLYYKQVSWLLESLCAGTKTKDDVQLLRNKGVYEWAMNLLNSPYLESRLRFQVFALLSTVQMVEGGDILMTRYAGVANVEQNLSKNASSVGTKLQSKQESLNLQELAVRYGLVGKSKKRIVDWTSDDIEFFAKRTISM